MNESQKSIATGILKIFCIGVGWQALGNMTIPVFFPLLAKQYDVSGVITGLILAMSPMMTIVSVPFINKYIETVGVEATIFTSGLMFSAAFCLMAFATWTASTSTFLFIAFIGAALIGISVAASIVGEQALLLRYSDKDEREKNLGMFRAGSGLGGLLSPILGAAMYAIGDFFAVFLFVGIGYFLICPFIYKRLYTSRDLFLQERARAQREDLAEEEQLLENGAQLRNQPATSHKVIRSIDLMSDRYFLMAMLCMVTWTGGFLYVSTILNPMLLEYYQMETEKSSLFYTLAGVAFLISTPIAFQLRSRKLMARRAILVMGMWLMGFSMIIRTGNLKQNENLWMVYLAQIVNGSAFSILTTTTFPEIVDSVENRPDYYQYDKESMNLHISGMFVFISAIAQLLGVFLGSSFAGTWGYNTAFIIIGMTLIAFGCLYGLICGVNEGFDRIRNEIIGIGSDPSADVNARHSKSMECHSERLRDSDSQIQKLLSTSESKKHLTQRNSSPFEIDDNNLIKVPDLKIVGKKASNSSRQTFSPKHSSSL